MVEHKSTNVHWQAGFVSRADRNTLLRQQGATLWFTGLSGSGKSTVACAVELALLKRGHLAYRLDGDNVRIGLNQNLGFSAEDRAENIRRVGEASKLFADAGVIALSSFISPYREDRRIARATHERDGMAFIEIFVDCPLAVAESRDPKGLYKKARSGQIKHFTGIDDPYEAPEKPEIHLQTARTPLEQEVAQVLTALEQRGIIEPATTTHAVPA
ncbi:MAG TPA: adenylyl-sulfate kinase [Nevskiaceae bacterium]|nr:adenylyl-sulfate kinase [Nevskiaceae bacterium]